MKITLIVVGKIKEQYYKMAISEYSKRLSRYCKLDIIEVADEKTMESSSEAEEEIIKKKEAGRILKHIRDDSHIVTLEIKGNMLNSDELSGYISKLGLNGVSHITFIIGGSIGLHKSIMEKSNYKLSFSKMTFPHQLMRVILLEQIYRSYKIICKEPYHK